MSMGGGGSSGSQTVTQNTAPWEGQQPYLTDIYKQAQDLYKTPGPDYYPGSAVVKMSPETQMALDAQTQRALNGSPLEQGAQDYAQQVLSGSFLSGGNPYFQGAFNAMATPVTNAVQAAMARSGRLGSGAETGVLAQRLGDIGSKLMFQNYENERGLQDAMSRFAPQLAEVDYNNIGKLAQVGSAYEGQAGAELQDDMNRFSFYQNQPWDKLSQYAGTIMQGNPGSSTTETRPIYGSTFGQAVGGLTSIAGLAGKLIPLFCWVAREVYGVDNPQWLRFRHYMLTRAPLWLFRLYARHGQRFAGTVRRKPWLKRVLRPVMNFLARKV